MRRGRDQGMSGSFMSLAASGRRRTFGLLIAVLVVACIPLRNGCATGLHMSRSGAAPGQPRLDSLLFYGEWSTACRCLMVLRGGTNNGEGGNAEDNEVEKMADRPEHDAFKCFDPRTGIRACTKLRSSEQRHIKSGLPQNPTNTYPQSFRSL